MTVQLFLQEEQLRSLGLIRDLGPKTIKSIIDKLSSLDPIPIKISILQQALGEILTGRSPNEPDIILRQLMSLCTLRRARNISDEDLLEGLEYGFRTARSHWSEEEISRWKELSPLLKTLFSLPAIETVNKSLGLSYDYPNLLQSIGILTDIRPIFDEEASNILGTIISYTLRIRFSNLGEDDTIAIALDEEDVKKLLSACNRALKKAQTAKGCMEKSDMGAVIISGEEN